jgi:hypothetical protein
MSKRASHVRFRGNADIVGTHVAQNHDATWAPEGETWCQPFGSPLTMRKSFPATGMLRVNALPLAV